MKTTLHKKVQKVLVKAVGRIIIFILRPFYWFISWKWYVLTLLICPGWGGGVDFYQLTPVLLSIILLKKLILTVHVGQLSLHPRAQHLWSAIQLIAWEAHLCPIFLGDPPCSLLSDCSWGSTLSACRISSDFPEVKSWLSEGSLPTVWTLEVQLRPHEGSTPTVWRVNFHCLDAQIWLYGCSTLTVWRLNSGCLEA